MLIQFTCLHQTTSTYSVTTKTEHEDGEMRRDRLSGDLHRLDCRCSIHSRCSSKQPSSTTAIDGTTTARTPTTRKRPSRSSSLPSTTTTPSTTTKALTQFREGFDRGSLHVKRRRRRCARRVLPLNATTTAANGERRLRTSTRKRRRAASSGNGSKNGDDDGRSCRTASTFALIFCDFRVAGRRRLRRRTPPIDNRRLATANRRLRRLARASSKTDVGAVAVKNVKLRARDRNRDHDHTIARDDDGGLWTQTGDTKNCINKSARAPTRRNSSRFDRRRDSRRLSRVSAERATSKTGDADDHDSSTAACDRLWSRISMFSRTTNGDD